MQIKWDILALEIPSEVYEPSEDSFMLAEAAKLAKGEVLEIGCGSGIASLSCAKVDSKNRVLGVDVSPEAVLCASMNAKANRIKNAEFALSDMFLNVPPVRFDAILFNPPYLPTEYNEKLEGPLNEAFDGGKDGRKVLDHFLGLFDSHLKTGGSLFLVQSTLNGPKKTKNRLEKMGYHVETVLRQDFFFESVMIYEAKKGSG